jgi:hypothetical protein
MGMSEIRNDLHSAGQNVTTAREALAKGTVFDTCRALSAMRWAVVDLEQAMDETVTQARNDGATWQDIADRLGITRQGAQQRYGNVA